MSKTQEKTLPPLREDLRFVEGTTHVDGSPTWIVVDPVRGKYYQIGWDAYQILSRWKGRSAEAVLSEVRAETTSRATREDLDALLQFLYGNQLMRDPPSGGYHAYAAQAEAARPQWLLWLVHHYLFFQIPLVRPDRFLRATLPYVEWLFSWSVGWAIAIIGLIGLHLVSRQWEAFTTTFLHFFTPLGFVLYGLCLALVKVFHELGHPRWASR
jgi:putative peptide zinc metalloprotease protein